MLLDVTADRGIHLAGAATRCAPRETIEAGRPAARIPPGRRLRRLRAGDRSRTSAPSTPSSRTRPCWSAATMSSSSSAGCEPGINPEIEIGRFLTEIAAFANTPRAARHGRTDRGRRAAARSRSCTASWRTRATPGRSTSAYLDRYVEEQRAAHARRRRRKPGARRLSAAAWAMSDSASPKCSLRSPAATTSPDFAPEPITPDDLTAWIEQTAAARRARCSTSCRGADRACPKPTAALVERLLAYARLAARAAERDAAGQHRRA